MLVFLQYIQTLIILMIPINYIKLIKLTATASFGENNLLVYQSDNMTKLYINSLI